ncbi:MAG: ATP-binding cassette domain-containing protein [Caloramator sp.]|nr:ATP-binding cassette domain-containing protein [Caloramator sp.]
MDYILEVENLCYTYPDGTEALKDINLKIEKGEKISLIGLNGSGKTTLFLNLNGVLKPSKGKIIYKGKEIKNNRKDLNMLRKNVGIVFQNPDTQLFCGNVYEEVSFGAVNLGLCDDEIRRRVDRALISTNIYDYKDKAVHYLSYGQKKRVSIADILVMEPEIIIFDEPTSSLDLYHSKQVVKLFDEFSQKGTTVIISTHDIEIAYSWSDYIVVMKKGKVLAQGVPYDIFSKEDILRECMLEKPLILEIFENLKEKNLIKSSSSIPKNKKELLEILK